MSKEEDLLCGVDQSKNKFLPAKMRNTATKTRKVCLDYMKCSKKNCGLPDLEMSNEIKKQNPMKVLNIVLKCMKSKDINNCYMDKYAKISPKMKKIVDLVKLCKQKPCKKENDALVQMAKKLVKSVKLGKKMDKVKKLMKDSKFKKIFKKTFKKTLKKM